MKASDDPRREPPEREPRSSPGEDTTFMEEILLELSAQNEHARSERSQRAARISTPPKVDPAGKTMSHPPIIHVRRDDSFRTGEGMSRARAYLPVRTLPPNRAAPIETATVHIADPRRMPTMRVARPAEDTAPSAQSEIVDPANAPPKRNASAPRARSSVPPGEDIVPTLRSAPSHGAEEHPPRRPGVWIGGVAIAAVALAVAVSLTVHYWSSASPASAEPNGPPAPSVNAR
ncbi:MAG: hypothetical protein U0441_22390 [Polyangiaceae bacterium]